MKMLKVLLASMLLAFATVTLAEVDDYDGVSGSNHSAAGNAHHCNTPSTGCLGGDGGGDAGPSADAGDSGPAADAGDSGEGEGDSGEGDSGEGEGDGEGEGQAY